MQADRQAGNAARLSCLSAGRGQLTDRLAALPQAGADRPAPISTFMSESLQSGLNCSAVSLRGVQSEARQRGGAAAAAE